MIHYYSCDYYSAELSSFYDRIFAAINAGQKYYPTQKSWFYKVFLPGLAAKKRVILWAEDENGIIVGVLLLKKSPAENKICCIYVSPPYRRRKIATALFINAMAIACAKHLKISLSEEVMPELCPLLKKFGFILSDVKIGIYRKGKKEFFFN